MIDQFFPDRKFNAFLFDFDGTVADTMPAHLDAWNQALAFYDLTLTREQHHSWAGRPTREIVKLLSELHKVDLSEEQILKTKEIYYQKTVHQTQAIIPVLEIIKAAHGKIPMAIVSGSRRKAVETTLELMKLKHYFGLLVCAEDYIHGKPAPDCFLKAAQFFNVKPEDCLVFEDGILGIQAAQAAGMDYLKIEVHPEAGHKISR